MGIVSALGRNGTGITDYENFIQTDASINPGNSGGALVDTEGRLIGINTAIFSRTGGNQGIGFAVPANLAHSVMESILKTGRVTRGFLGIGLQPVTEELAERFKTGTTAGALVNEVQPKSPAEKAGIASRRRRRRSERQEDRRPARTAAHGRRPRARHEGGRQSCCATARKRRSPSSSPSGPARRSPARRTPNQAEDPDVLDGVTVGDLDPELRKQFEIPGYGAQRRRGHRRSTRIRRAPTPASASAT